MLTQEQIALRRTGICATDASAIIGANQWKSALAVALDKRGELPPTPDNANTERGNFLEPSILTWYGHRERCKVWPGLTVVNKDNPLIIATPDGFRSPGVLLENITHLRDSEAVVEAKAPGEYNLSEWGEPGTDEVPEAYWTQGQWQMAATGIARCDIAALIRGELRIYRLVRDEEAIKHLVNAAEEFWAKYVKGSELPKAQASDLGWLKQKFPRNFQDYIEAPADDPLVEMYRTEKNWVDGGQERLDAIKAQLQLRIGEHSGIKGSFGRIDWKKNKPSRVTDWEAVSTELRGMLELRGESGLDDVISRHTADTPGARPLRAYWSHG